MIINNAIIHWVKKEVQQDSILQKRQTELEVTPAVINLVTNVRDGYNNKTAKTYGVFNQQIHSYPFQGFVRSYLDNESTFIKFSEDAIDHFKEVIDREGLAKGGYVIFVRYTEGTTPFMMVMMLNDKTASAIDKQTLTINDTLHLDVEKLHFVSRLNIDKWENGEENYVTFIKGLRRRGVDYSNYFTDFIGCTDMTKPREATEKLIIALKDFIKSKGMSDAEDEAITEKLHSYCVGRRKEGRPVDLIHLSNYLNDENPEEFSTFANDEKYGLSNSFDPDPTTLKRLKRYSYRDKNFSISFSRDLMNKSIRYDKDSNILTISDIPESLIEQFES